MRFDHSQATRILQALASQAGFENIGIYRSCCVNSKYYELHLQLNKSRDIAEDKDYSYVIHCKTWNGCVFPANFYWKLGESLSKTVLDSMLQSSKKGCTFFVHVPETVRSGPDSIVFIPANSSLESLLVNLDLAGISYE